MAIHNPFPVGTNFAINLGNGPNFKSIGWLRCLTGLDRKTIVKEKDPFVGKFKSVKLPGSDGERA